MRRPCWNGWGTSNDQAGLRIRISRLPLLAALALSRSLITVFGLLHAARAARWARGLAFAILLFALAGPILVQENARAAARCGGDRHRPLAEHGRGRARRRRPKAALASRSGSCWQRSPT